MTIDPRTIAALLHSATWTGCSPRAELQAQLASSRASVALFERRLQQRPCKAYQVMLDRAVTRVAELDALQKTYASLNEDHPPVVHKRNGVCEPEIAHWAKRLQREVEQRAWEALNNHSK